MKRADRIRLNVLAGLPDSVEELLPPVAASAPPAGVDASAAREKIEAELARFLALMTDYPQRPGKTLRGQLLMLSAEAHGAFLTDDDGRASALTLASALELFQNWVLVHDDIEDASLSRRGAPALHQLVGVPVALNVGDAMHVAMWQLLLTLPPGSTDMTRRLLEEFASMIMRTAAGQHLDLAWVAAGRFDVSEQEYLTMVTMKTAYYTVVAPLRLGALLTGLEPDPLLEDAGRALGVAFQIRDDVLNLLPEMSHGKEHAGDLYEGKRTLILAHLLAHARADTRERVTELLDRPREEKTAAEMEEVRRLMVHHGSIDYAQAFAERTLSAGLSSLGAALEQVKGQEAAEEILTLVAELTGRVR